MLGFNFSPTPLNPPKGVPVPPAGYRWIYDLDGVSILADLDGSLMYEAI